jgi:hypothetical protein
MLCKVAHCCHMHWNAQTSPSTHVASLCHAVLVCCATLMQLDTSAAALLPHLNRDDIEAAANGPKQQQQQHMQRRGGMRISRTGSLGPASGAIAAAAAAAAALAATGEGRGAAGSLNSHRGTTTEKEADAAKLLHHKTVIHFNTIDRLVGNLCALCCFLCCSAKGQ